MKCDTCKGSGKVRQTMSMVINKEDIKEMDCPYCEGTGEILNKTMKNSKWTQGNKK